MVKIRTIQIRLSRQQYEQIKNDSMVKGFATLSSYLRFLALHRDQTLTKKVIEIHDAIFSKTNGGKNGRSNRSRLNRLINEDVQLHNTL